MNEARDIIRDGAVAVRGARIVDVGKASRPRARYAPARDDRRRPLRRHAGHGQHPHPHHRRAADPRLRPRRHAVRGERVRVAVPAVLGVRRRRGAHVGASSPPSRCCARAPPRSSRRARSGSSTTSIDGLVEVGIRGRVGRWVWDLPPEPSVYRQTHRRGDRPPAAPARRAPRRTPTGGSRRGASSSATRRAATRCGGPPRQLADEHGVGMSLPHVAGASSIPTASSPSSGSGRWSTSTRSACSTATWR